MSEVDHPDGLAHASEDGDWTSIGSLEELSDGRSVRVQAFGTDVLVVRSGDRTFAVANRCTHQGAPLDRGVARLEGSMPTVTCAAHGSVFSLEDGGVRRGPATQPLAAYESRVKDGIGRAAARGRRGVYRSLTRRPSARPLPPSRPKSAITPRITSTSPQPFTPSKAFCATA